MRRILNAWHALVGGDIGPIGWCGQDGYWWTRPCPHYYHPEVGRGHGGCGWYNGVRIVMESP